MDTFAELAEHVEARFDVVHRDKFMLGVELQTGGRRRQSVFLAELKDSDDRRILRLETTVSPLGHHDPVKVLRVNLMLRGGYLAVGDLEGVPFLKLCDNLDFRYLSVRALEDRIERLGSLGDVIEDMLTHGHDYF
ncbi:hypothetical protein HFP89_00995 [Wenzhouxiangella sp. XN79A]|uniref:hypothetical protein n=1 Tax=Wenzhouxiangella sp. XN79A TaxID=2724193 RepID=UPI00144AF678|nr:hypothetical protein [Wenzhouxiangella sp. XN79A]NKI33740.1 hypothetical protein [Wenzhouxiangella sp. XN79A]